MRRTHTRSLRTLYALLAMLLLLAACAPTAAPSAPAASDAPAQPGEAAAADFEWVTPDRVGDPNAPIVLTIALDATYSHQSTTQSRVDYLVPKYEAWTRANPDVQLVFQPYTGNIPQDAARLLELAASRRAPDLAMVDGQLAPIFFPFLQPLDEYVSDEELADWFSWAREGGMIDPADGALKALWFTTNTVGLWYRQDLLPEPPRSWDDYIATALAMKEEGFTYGFMANGVGEQIPYGDVLPFFFSLGGTLVDDSGTPIFGQEPNRSIMIEALDFWRRAIEEGATDATILDIGTTPEAVALISAESTPMLMAGSWLLPSIKQAADEEQWNFTHLPQKDPNNPAQVVGGWTWGVFTDDPAKQALAVDFVMDVYAGSEGMAGWCEAGGYSPVRESVYQDYPYFSEDRWQQAFSAAIAYGRTRPGVEAYPIMSEAIRNAFQQVILGVATPEAAVDEAWTYVELETQ
jgi:multiple sugar transport system substrate-binding protein